MTAQTVGSAVARRDKENMLVDWLRDQQADIAMAAASHVKPSAIVRVTQGALRKNEKLAAAAIANPQSLLYCLLDCARLGHEPDTDDYYLVPFGNEVTGIEGYKGIIERMYRAGGVSAVVAEVVRRRDRYSPRGSTTPPAHEYDVFADPEERGELRGAYAYAILAGGQCSQVIPMGKAEIMRHKAKSRGSEKPDSPWQQWPEAMWKKTVLRALEPYVPTSTEYRTLAASQPVPQPAILAGAPAPGPAGNGHPVAPEPVYDAEIVEEPPDPAPAQSAPKPSGQQAGKPALDKMAALLRQLELGTEEDVAALIRWVAGDQYAATRGEVKTVTDFLEDHLRQAEGDPAEACSQIWRQYLAAKDRAAGDQPGSGGDHD